MSGMRSPTADREEQDRGHLAQRVLRDAVPAHPWPHGPVCRERGARRSCPPARPVAREPAGLRTDLVAAREVYAPGGGGPAGVRAFPAPRLAAVPPGGGRVP